MLQAQRERTQIRVDAVLGQGPQQPGFDRTVEPLDLAASLGVAARGDLVGPVVTVLPDAWDRYRAKAWMQGWGL